MFDFNLAIIDVATAWVAVMLPRFIQAKLLRRWGVLPVGESDRLRPDPVQHMSMAGTLAVPAITSLLQLPVLAWGKTFDDSQQSRNLNRARALVLASSLAYAVQALAFTLLMMLLANIYLAGAPVAARAGQLCLRLAMLNLLAIPIMDAGIAWRFVVPSKWATAFVSSITGAVWLFLLWFSGALAWIDRTAVLLFFEISQLG